MTEPVIVIGIDEGIGCERSVAAYVCTICREANLDRNAALEHVIEKHSVVIRDVGEKRETIAFVTGGLEKTEYVPGPSFVDELKRFRYPKR